MMIDNHPLTDRNRTYAEVTDTSITYEVMTLQNDENAMPFPLEPDHKSQEMIQELTS